MVQHPSDGTKVLGGLCGIVHLGDVAPGPFPPQELLAGKEPVHHEVQCQVQLVTVSVQPKSPVTCPPSRPTKSRGAPRMERGGSMHV